MNQPIICIDQRRSRLRIHKQTLHMLGDPTHIQILVNPNNLTLAIKCAGPKDTLTHRVVNRKKDTKQSYEIYSRCLVQELYKLCPAWDQDELYKCTGEIIASESIARFDLSSSLIYIAQEDGDGE